jgi:hypothetical protein
VDLNGLSIVNNAQHWTIGDTDPSCVGVDTATPYAVIGGANAANYDDVPLLYAIGDPSGDTLFSASCSTPCTMQLKLGDTVIDEMTYTSPSTGRSWSLDPDFLDATTNDTASAAPSNWCKATTLVAPFSGGTACTMATCGGSPGAANEQCP